jgi:hypothetical protein
MPVGLARAEQWYQLLLCAPEEQQVAVIRVESLCSAPLVAAFRPVGGRIILNHHTQQDISSSCTFTVTAAAQPVAA